MKWREYSFDKWACYGLLLIGLFILQSTVADLLTIGRVQPNFLLCAFVGIAMREGEIAGGLFGLFWGFLVDTLYAHVSGFYLVLGLLFGGLIGRVTKVYLNITVVNAMIVGTITSLAYNILIFYTHYYTAGVTSSVTAFAHVILPDALYVAVMMGPFYYLTGLCKRLTTAEEREE